MVTPCQACGKGPLEAAGHEPVDLAGSPGRRLTARCRQCGAEKVFTFDMSQVHEAKAAGAGQSGLPLINPGKEPSRAIDPAQWLMLFEAIVRAADQQTDPAESRRLGYEAAQCLEEALKFYPADSSEWPDESAFFSEATLDRFRRHKHLFARTRLVDLRRKLPTLTEMERRLSGQPAKDSGRAADQSRKRRWWPFWR